MGNRFVSNWNILTSLQFNKLLKCRHDGQLIKQTDKLEYKCESNSENDSNPINIRLMIAYCAVYYEQPKKMHLLPIPLILYTETGRKNCLFNAYSCCAILPEANKKKERNDDIVQPYLMCWSHLKLKTAWFTWNSEEIPFKTVYQKNAEGQMSPS